MKNKINFEFWIKYILIVLIGIFITLIIYFLSYNLQIPKTITTGTVDGWLGYFGGLIGGIMTLIGVWITIDWQKSQKKYEEAKNNKLLYKPIIQLELENDNNIINIYSFNDKELIDIPLLIKNVGNGEAIISNINAYLTYEQDKSFQMQPFYSLKYGFEYPYFIYKDTKTKNYIYIDTKIIKDNQTMFSLSCTVEYKDMFNNAYISYSVIIFNLDKIIGESYQYVLKSSSYKYEEK